MSLLSSVAAADHQQHAVWIISILSAGHRLPVLFLCRCTRGLDTERHETRSKKAAVDSVLFLHGEPRLPDCNLQVTDRQTSRPVGTTAGRIDQSVSDSSDKGIRRAYASVSGQFITLA